MGVYQKKEFMQGQVAIKKSCKEEVKKKISCRVNCTIELTNCTCLKGTLAANLYTVLIPIFLQLGKHTFPFLADTFCVQQPHHG